jgi:electron transport complex protein RnfB
MQLFWAIVSITLLGTLFGLGLGWAAKFFRVQSDPLVDQIDSLLPQTQCGLCDFPGCRPYAQAIASGEAEINQCPPGGEAGVKALAALLGREPLELNPQNGETKGPLKAVIDESVCIGCKLCILACPVDAILGASKQMHTVIQSECTGCELCLPPCPVDCIDLVTVEPTLSRWQAKRPGTPPDFVQATTSNVLRVDS